MLTFLFWNLAKASLEDAVARLVHRHGIDILVLAECDAPIAFANTINRRSGDERVFLLAGPSHCERIAIISRFEPKAWFPLRESAHYSLRTLSLPARPPLIIGGLHLPSKRHLSREGQFIEAMQIAEMVRVEENRQKNQNTILIGDFNMNPFEGGMLAASGFHAVSSRDVAAKGSRRISGADYPFFYNPMWGHLGDRFPGPPGTYFYPQSEQVAAFWHVFDQVLIRPGLAPSLLYDSIEVLDHDGESRLTAASGRPRRTRNSSDHLPFKFSFVL